MALRKPPASPPSLPAFRRRQAVAAGLMRRFFDDLSKTAPETVQRRACWVLVNELYDRLCCRAHELTAAEIQAIGRTLSMQARDCGTSPARRRSARAAAHPRRGPLPETLARAIRELYGGVVRVRSSKPQPAEIPANPESADKD